MLICEFIAYWSCSFTPPKGQPLVPFIEHWLVQFQLVLHFRFNLTNAKKQPGKMKSKLGAAAYQLGNTIERVV